MTKLVRLKPHDPKKGADGLGGVSGASDDLAHVRSRDLKRQKHAHFVNFAVHLDFIWLVHKGLHDVFEEFRVSEFFCHFTFAVLDRFRMISRGCDSRSGEFASSAATIILPFDLSTVSSTLLAIGVCVNSWSRGNRFEFGRLRFGRRRF